MAKKTERRWRFVSDDDGHDYLIPAGWRKQFIQWVAANLDEKEYDGMAFDEYRIGYSPSNYTFTDPKQE